MVVSGGLGGFPGSLVKAVLQIFLRLLVALSLGWSGLAVIGGGGGYLLMGSLFCLVLSGFVVFWCLLTFHILGSSLRFWGPLAFHIHSVLGSSQAVVRRLFETFFAVGVEDAVLLGCSGLLVFEI
ncbi:unnamed protein product [Amaranthus hypochondriacus]